nr:TlpA disulfide reductase family protein [Allomuricauda sp.]
MNIILNAKTKLFIISAIILFILAILLLEHSRGGVVSHHLLANENLPKISNWWGLLTIPIISWFILLIIQRGGTNNQQKRVSKTQVYGFISSFLFGIVLTILFYSRLGFHNYILLLSFALALFIPIYKTEYYLGFILSMAYGFGGILPVVFGLVLIAIYALEYKLIRNGFLFLKNVISKRILIILSLVFFTISCDNRKKKSISPVKIGDKINISDYDLVNVKNGKIEKNKLLLLDFWATWCGPCIASFPHLEKLQEKYKNDLQIIAISDENVDVVNDFLAKKTYELKFLNDVDKQLFKKFAVTNRPTRCLISKDGEFIWVGNSKDFEKVLIEYLDFGQISEPNITEFNKAYYNLDSITEKKIEFDNYQLSEGKNPKLYFAKNQKNEDDLIDITYVSVPVTDVIMDFLEIKDLSLINNKPELDTILLNIKAKSGFLTYGQGKTKILNDIQNVYNFNIKTKSKNTDVYILKIINPNLLEKHFENIEGGGMVERKSGQHIVTRLSLKQLASYLQNRLKIHIQFEGENDSKYNFVFDDFENLESLKPQFDKIGIGLSKLSRDVKYFEIN